MRGTLGWDPSAATRQRMSAGQTARRAKERLARIKAQEKAGLVVLRKDRANLEERKVRALEKLQELGAKKRTRLKEETKIAEEKVEAAAIHLERAKYIAPRSEWAEKYYTIKGKKFNLSRHPWLRGILRDTADFIALMKARQMGGTEILLIDVLRDAVCEEDIDQVVTMPTDGLVGTTSGVRFNSAVRGLGKMWKDLASLDNIGQKSIAGNAIYFRGAYQTSQGISIAADKLVNDEVDYSDQDILAEFEACLGESAHPQKRRFSTPTSPEWGIHLDFLRSDQKHYVVKCPHCGKEWCQCDAWDEGAVEIADAKNAFYKCPNAKCGSPFEVISCWDETMMGRWVAAHPGEPVSGWHFAHTLDPARPLKYIQQDPRSILQELEKWGMIKFYNWALGLPQSKGTKVDKALRDKLLIGSYQWKTESKRSIAALDTGGDLHLIIGEPDDRGGWKLVLAKTLHDWDSLEYYVEQYNIDLMLVDFGNDTTLAKRWQAKHPDIIWLVRYDKKPYMPTEWDATTGVVHTNRSDSLDALFEWLADGMVVWPNDDEGEKVWIHLTHLIRKEVWDPRSQTNKAEYVSTKPTHYAHTLNYFRLAAEQDGGGGFRVLSPSQYMEEINRQKAGTKIIDPGEL